MISRWTHTAPQLAALTGTLARIATSCERLVLFCSNISRSSIGMRWFVATFGDRRILVLPVTSAILYSLIHCQITVFSNGILHSWLQWLTYIRVINEQLSVQVRPVNQSVDHTQQGRSRRSVGIIFTVMNTSWPSSGFVVRERIIILIRIGQNYVVCPCRSAIDHVRDQSTQYNNDILHRNQSLSFINQKANLKKMPS